LELFVVIPCYNEPDIISAIDSLKNCLPPTQQVTVIVTLNSEIGCSESVTIQNHKSLSELDKWKKTSPNWLNLIIENVTDVPLKIAGVGHARKHGMDKAYDLAINKKESIIICYDADCLCSANYLRAIENAFNQNQKCDVASIYFEHSDIVQQGIIDYELFLRYHYQGLRYTGYPYAYQTIGSSMAVRAKTYHDFGGMNMRKAGEDFYFLHKIIPYRDVLEINDCAVYPSSRTSDRVPFGTGHAVAKYSGSTCKTYYTYHPIIYLQIKKLIDAVKSSKLTEGGSLDTVPPTILEFLADQGFDSAVINFKNQSKTDVIFRQSIFRWLNGFRMLKLVHFLRDQSHTNIPLNDAVTRLWKQVNQVDARLTNVEWLKKFRSLEKR
jgi:hypothetical protein